MPWVWIAWGPISNETVFHVINGHSAIPRIPSWLAFRNLHSGCKSQHILKNARLGKSWYKWVVSGEIYSASLPWWKDSLGIISWVHIHLPPAVSHCHPTPDDSLRFSVLKVVCSLISHLKMLCFVQAIYTETCIREAALKWCAPCDNLLVSSDLLISCGITHFSLVSDLLTYSIGQLIESRKHAQ